MNTPVVQGSLQVGSYWITWGVDDLGHPESLLLLGGERVGFANAEWLDGNLWNAHALHIQPGHRGQSLGSWLLLALEEAVKIQKGVDQKLVPADWLGRSLPTYIPGQGGTTLAALKAWEKLS